MSAKKEEVVAICTVLLNVRGEEYVKSFNAGSSTEYVESKLRSRFRICGGGLELAGSTLAPGPQLEGGITYVFTDFAEQEEQQDKDHFALGIRDLQLIKEVRKAAAEEAAKLTAVRSRSRRDRTFQSAPGSKTTPVLATATATRNYGMIMSNLEPLQPRAQSEVEVHLESLHAELRVKKLRLGHQGGVCRIFLGVETVLSFTTDRPEHVRLARLCICFAGGIYDESVQRNFNNTVKGGFDLKLASPKLLDIIA